MGEAPGRVAGDVRDADEARYVTGLQLRVDAGGYLKWYDYRT